ncbi:MAG: SET domain-containing protein-lysine N-methyltransferase [Candidatus Omnitrophica bacterium]|nr:SET domain-containing protein-lysine N-methyltransferase [Candidatus Omnitrophota bacterium]
MIKNRFYPDSLPEFPYEPKPGDFRIQKIGDSVGNGVMALKSFLPGDIVFAFTGFLVTEITQYSLRYRNGLHVHDPFFMGKVLHCCNPNTYCNMETRQFIAVQAINPGELITMDYLQTEDVLFKPFNCSCGAPNCRGYVSSREEALAPAFAR